MMPIRNLFLLTISALFIIGFSSCGPKSVRKDGTPKRASIQLDSTTAQLGTFPRSASMRTTVFTFTNVGDAPLEFLDMSVSCNCISAVYPDKPVKPGKKGEIVVTYKGNNKNPGKFQYRVYFAVTGSPRTFFLRVKGDMTEN